MRLGYEGTAYSGWQRQPNAVTVQEVIEEKLSTLMNEKTTVLGCGRTDAGVHATEFFAHFETRSEIDTKTIRFKLNNMLPKDILIELILEVPDKLHARYSATSRSYIYTLSKEKPLLDRNYVYRYYNYHKLDITAMMKAAEIVSQNSEFDPFCKTGTDVKTKTCIISESRIEVNEEEGRIEYHISANRFLRGMVRLLMGMILNVGRGSVPLDEVRQVFEDQTRLVFDWSVPARGLRLSKVIYPPELLDPSQLS